MICCFWCRREDMLPTKITQDHLIPRWARLVLHKHGLALPVSLLRKVIACQNCNGDKLGMPPADYAELRSGKRPALKAAEIAWNNKAARFSPAWCAVPANGKPTREELIELQVAMSRPFLHHGIAYGHGSLRVPTLDYQMAKRAVIRIDTRLLSKQPEPLAEVSVR